MAEFLGQQGSWKKWGIKGANLPKNILNNFQAVQLRKIFEEKYPELMNGGEFGDNMKSDIALTFFSEWFCGKNIASLINELSRLDIGDIKNIAAEVGEMNEDRSVMDRYLGGLMYGKSSFGTGKTPIKGSKVLSCLARLSQQLEDELGHDKFIIHRIGFILTLPTAQRNKHFRNLASEFDLEQREILVSLAEKIRVDLIRMISHVEM